MDSKETLGPPELDAKTAAEEPEQSTPQLVHSSKSAASSPAEVEEAEDSEDDLNEHVEAPADPDGVVEAERKQQVVREEHPAMPTTPKALYKHRRRWPVVLVILILLAAAAAGAYWFGNRQASTSSSKKSTSQNATTTPKATTATKQYNSTALGVALSYPAPWKPAETSAKLSITSPAMQLGLSTGKKVSGHIVVTIEPQQTTLPQFASGNATATLASQKLTYVQPTSVQRAQTYLSFLSYAGGQGGLDALYITGDNGYQAGQAIPLVDVVKANPLISVTFDSCATADCGSGTVTPLSVSASLWQNTSISTPLVNLLQSIELS